MIVRRMGLSAVLAVGLLGVSLPLLAEPTPEENKPTLPEGFDWKTEGVGKLGDRAQIDVTEGHVYLNGSDTSKLLQAMGNLSDHDELGLIGSQDLEWFAVFFFDDVGYVKDDDKEELDQKKMASAIEENLERGNGVREERGLEALNFDGWAMPPRYNESSKQLEWATRLKSASGVSVNYNTRVLGRKGVIRVILVTDPDKLDSTLPNYQKVMDGFSFIEGQRYAEFREGDKIAEYGLAALVVGGAGALAAKTGLLAAVLAFFKKGFKLIIAGVVGLFALIKKFFTGERITDDAPPPADEPPEPIA